MGHAVAYKLLFQAQSMELRHGGVPGDDDAEYGAHKERLCLRDMKEFWVCRL